MSDAGEGYILPSGFSDIPLLALRNGARRKIALFLNLEGALNDDVGMLTNYEGLAELIGFDYLEIRNFGLQKSPTETLLHEWTTRHELAPSLGNLRKFLLELGRVDVLTDIWDFLLRDCEAFQKKRSYFQSNQAPIQDYTVSSGSIDTAPDHHVDESVIMTVDDVEQGTPQVYDAFVCYSPEGNDLAFVKQLIEKLEGEEFKLKLFVPWRDDLPGSSRDTICAKLIETRCKRMLIVLSQQYLQSSSCEFQTKFAHSLSPGARSKRLVPILTEPCNIPQILRYVTLCDYTKTELREWFWKRLAQALKSPLDPEQYVAMQSDSLKSVLLNTSNNIPLWSTQNSSSSSLSSLSLSSSSSTNSSSSSSSQSLPPLPARPSVGGYASIGMQSQTITQNNRSSPVASLRSSSPRTNSASPKLPPRNRASPALNRSDSPINPPSLSQVPPPLPANHPRKQNQEYFC